MRAARILRIFCACVLVVLTVPLIMVLTSHPLYSVSKTKFDQEKKTLTDQEDILILEKTNSYYNKGQYERAVETVNVGIELNRENGNIPDNIKLMAEASYYAWVNYIYKNYEIVPEKKCSSIMTMVSLHPEAVSTRTKGIIDEIYEGRRTYLENERISAIANAERKKLKSVTEKIKRLEQDKKSLDDVIAGLKPVQDVQRGIELEKEYNFQRRIKYLMLGLYVITFIAFVILIIVFTKQRKHSIDIQNQFETTMKVVAIMNKDVTDEIVLQKTSGSTADTKSQMAVHRNGLSDAETEKRIKLFFEEDEDKKEFLVLQKNCVILGDKVDKITGRIRNSKKVSELVFKMCKASGLSDEVSLIYYCAAMVHDAGFLSIDKDVLLREHLTIKERLEVRSHIQKAVDYFGFVPDKLLRIFTDAAEFHHENFDGKGYSEGLKGTKIPLIARIIRVAESYVSLVNVRAYRQIMDTQSAIREIQKQASAYDPKVLLLLDKVV